MWIRWTTPITRKAGSTLVTLPRNVTPYRDSVEGTRDRVTYQKLVTRPRDRVTNFWYVTPSRVASTLSRYGVTLRGHESPPHCHDTALRYAVTSPLHTVTIRRYVTR